MTKVTHSALADAEKILLIEKCKRDKIFWLSNYVYTFNEKAEEGSALEAISKFPVKEYVVEIIKQFDTARPPIVHVAKSRQMMLSWLGMAYLLHKAMFQPFRFNVVISQKLEQAEKMVDRIVFMYSRMPKWLQDACPLDRKLRDMPKGHLFFENGSKIQGLAQGKDQIRSYVVSTAFLDEAAFQDDFEQTYGACVPCCKQILTVSSAGEGFFKKLCEL